VIPTAARLTAWLRNVFSRGAVEQQLDDELRAYAELLSDEKARSGLNPGEAWRAALIELGGIEQVKEEVRGVRVGSALEHWWKDLQYAFRSLRRTPGFSTFAVVALSLGIGASTAVFSVVDAVLLRPLPLADPDRLVCVWEENRQGGWPQQTPAPANFMDWRARNRVFTDMGALQGVILAITGEGPPEQVEGNPVTANLFSLLGVSPVIGRHISPDEDRPGAPKVALISYGLWQRRFGGDSAVLGGDLHLDRVPHRIIGVMPPGFAFPDRSDVWVPIAFTSRHLMMRDNHYLRVFARLKHGVSVADAQRDMARIAAELSIDYPATNSGLGASVTNLKDQMVGDTRLGLWVLLGGVACLLLLTCINVSGLLLARGIARSREFAVRVSLGASRSHLARHAILEAAILSLAAFPAGWLVALGVLEFLLRLVPPELIGWAQPTLDVRLAIFSATTAIVATLIAALLPALAASRVDPAGRLQRGGHAEMTGRSAGRRALVVGQIALSVILCVGAGLMIQTFRSLSNVDLGFVPDGVLTARTSLPLSAMSPYLDFARREAFYRQVLEGVRAIPGVISAGYTTFLPLTNGGGSSYFTIAGEAPPAREDENDANNRVITADYLQTIGVRLRAGRYFDESDGPSSMPAAIVNEAMAQRYWRGRNPVGTRIRLGDPEAPWITIVGLVETVRQNGIALAGRPEIYFPATQPHASYGWTAPRDLAVRVQGPPLRYATALRQAVWAVDRNQPVTAVMPLRQLVDDKLAFRNTLMRLLAAFAALALLMAALGLYGVLAYDFRQRTREIGVRVALGAPRGQILLMALADGLKMVGLGLAIGISAAWFLSGLAQGFLYGVSQHDAATYLWTAVVLAGCGLLASLGPAMRAASIDPMTALRLE
jgi:predicted permease